MSPHAPAGRRSKRKTPAGSILRTSDLARAVGVHPNTVRLYEEWGLLPPIPRSPAGYRRFSPFHLDQMRLARTALRGPYPGKSLRRTAYEIIRRSAGGDLGGALELAYGHMAAVGAELAQAEAAVRFMERWAQGAPVDSQPGAMQIGEASQFLDVTRDALRNWERNGLLRVPRSPANGYRLYTAAELGRLRVIRMLRRAGYSLMAILRMLLALDRGQSRGLREVLDTPAPDEDVYTAADRWISALSEYQSTAQELIAQLEQMIQNRVNAGEE